MDEVACAHKALLTYRLVDRLHKVRVFSCKLDPAWFLPLARHNDPVVREVLDGVDSDRAACLETGSIGVQQGLKQSRPVV
jgi:hypothetical protein